MYKLQFDGLFRGTKKAHKAGVMCFGWLIYYKKQVIAYGYGSASRGIEATSNIAEYLALIDGLEALADIQANYEPVQIMGDSKVIINQMRGIARIKAKQVEPLHHKACQLVQLLNVADWRWVPRRYNKAADRLTRRALREFRADPYEEEAAWQTVLTDHVRRHDQLHILGGMMVFQGIS